MRTSAFGLPATLTLRIESIGPHALQIPAHWAEASLLHLFFNLIFTLNPNRLQHLLER